MQFELKITPHDLKVILEEITSKRVVLTLKLKDTQEVIEDVTISDFDTRNNLITILSKISEHSYTRKVSYLEIECLEFQSFYDYKSCSAKKFNVE
jgi:hypothetical protein